MEPNCKNCYHYSVCGLIGPILRQTGTTAQLCKKYIHNDTLMKEEDAVKFYYMEDRDKYIIGRRLDTFYYAEPTKTGDFAFFMSRYLPWGETVTAPHTLWKEYTYPKEPIEMGFVEWLKGLMKQQGWEWTILK